MTSSVGTCKVTFTVSDAGTYTSRGYILYQLCNDLTILSDEENDTTDVEYGGSEDYFSLKEDKVRLFFTFFFFLVK